MRQVTGRSCKNSDTKASIRLAMGGRFFSASLLENVAESGDVLVRVYTSRTTLLPSEVKNSISAEQALSITGQAAQDTEIAVYSETVDGRCAAVALSKDAYTALSEALEGRAKITSPLLDTTHSGEKCLAVEIADSVAYLRLYNNGLRLAEALKIESADEFLYYVAEIFKTLDVAIDTPIYIIGDSKLSKLLKKYYRVVCE